MGKIGKLIIQITISITVCIVLGILINSFFRRSTQDLSNTKKAQKTFENLINLRNALEKYYKVAGHYPDLTIEDVNNNLHLLDYVNDKGETISFAEIYGRNSLPNTEASGKIRATNKVYNTKNFDNGTLTGGWNYNYIEKNGEIHANLPKNVYFQGIDWQQY